MIVRRPNRGLGITLTDLAGAITRFEGACSAPGVCNNNNPGNLRTPGSGAWPGQTGTSASGFAVFDTFADGQAALISQEQTNINRGLTLDQFFGGAPGVYAGYAPAADSNDPGAYSQTVAGWLGISNQVPLSSLVTSGDTTIPAPDLSGSWDATAPIDLSTVDGSLSDAAWLAIGAAVVLALWAIL